MKREWNEALVTAIALVMTSSPVLAQERARAENSPTPAKEKARATVSCSAGAEKLTYECRIELLGAKSGTPVTGADVTVGADMPSMPGAHNVKPVKATPTGEPGAYKAKLALEMHGEWALKITVTGRVRDVVIHRMRFD
jgi:hypothetical protein